MTRAQGDRRGTHPVARIGDAFASSTGPARAEGDGGRTDGTLLHVAGRTPVVERRETPAGLAHGGPHRANPSEGPRSPMNTGDGDGDE